MHHEITDRSRAFSTVAFALLAVAMFAGTLPMTRVTVGELSPAFVGVGRAAAAAPLAVLYLRLARAGVPDRRHWQALLLVVIGVVIGFPLLTSIAMNHMRAANAAATVSLVPMFTAIFGVLFGRERHARRFWFAVAAGVACAMLSTLARSGGPLSVGDLVMLAAVALVGLGYASGAVAARAIGGAATISWALVLALPVTLPTLILTRPAHGVSVAAGVAFAYVSVFSMFVGFLFWYAALARGGIGRIGQLQLLQPIAMLAISATLLGEPVTWRDYLSCVAILACVTLALRSKGKPPGRADAYDASHASAGRPDSRTNHA